MGLIGDGFSDRKREKGLWKRSLYAGGSGGTTSSFDGIRTRSAAASGTAGTGGIAALPIIVLVKFNHSISAKLTHRHATPAASSNHVLPKFNYPILAKLIGPCDNTSKSLLPFDSDDTIFVGFGDKAAVFVGGLVEAGGDVAGVCELAVKVDIGPAFGPEGLEGFNPAPALPSDVAFVVGSKDKAAVVVDGIASWAG